MPDPMSILIPVLIASATGFVGWWSVKRRAYTAYWSLLGIAVLASLGLLAAVNAAQGMDGIIYIVLLVVTSLPAVGGLLLGGLIGHIMRTDLTVPS